MRYRSVALLVVVVALSGMWAGFQSVRDDDFYAMRKNFELFGEVYEEVVGSYQVRVDPERFMRTGMDAMLATLDPWTDFLDEADNVAMQLRSQPGIGEVNLLLDRREGRITVLTPESSTGAYRQGVRTGDVVLEVSGQPTDSLSVVQVHELLRGEPDTTVPVVIERPGSGRLEFQLLREAPDEEYVTFAGRVEGTDVAMVRLSVFGPGLAHEVDSALEDLREEGPLAGVVLDLRDNPGGLVSEAINLVALFVPEGTPVVSTRGRAPEANRLYVTDESPDWADLPLTLLVNQSSASASEIVAGALQDLDRAVVVGEPTFGKGLVQVVRPLPYHTALKLTYSRYFTPSGRGIRKDALEAGGAPIQRFRTSTGREVREGNGIEPDVAVETPAASELESALLRDAAFFRFAGHLVAERGDELLAAASASGDVVLPEGTVDEFRLWLAGDGFTWRSELDARLADLEDVLGGAGGDPLNELRALSEAGKTREFEAASAALHEALTAEVAARLLDPAERVRMSLRSDSHVLAAVQAIETGGIDRLLGRD